MPKYHLCIPILQTSTIPNNLCLNLVAIKKNGNPIPNILSLDLIPL